MSVLAWLRRHRELIALWVLAVLFACACVLLGRWQLHRYQDKHATAQLVTRNQAAAPVPLSRLLPGPSSRLADTDKYRAVTVQGTYDVDGTRLVRNRPHRGDGADATFGYEVVVPLVLADGSAFLVDRGWVPNGASGSAPGGRPDAVPEPPAGHVSVVARLRASEPVRSQELPAGQVGSVSVAEIARGTGRPTYRAYGALLQETPAPASAPALLDPVTTEGGEGINASYAVQWAVFALLGLGFPVWIVRRRREAAAELAEHALPPDEGAAPEHTDAQPTEHTENTENTEHTGPGTGTGVRDRGPQADDEARRGDRRPAPVGQRPTARTRRRRHHVWDDEDE
jgi:cytochrome oxidase assembly protein ShyY1